jgi:ribosomal protein S18 acetylase RimI-like enzyme
MPDPAPVVRELDPALDTAWAEAALDDAFGGRLQARRGLLVDVLVLPGLIAMRDGEPIGLLLYDPDDGAGEAELAALATPVRGAGAGTALVGALVDRVPDRPIWAVTTNDNLDALGFYQRLGFRLRTVRPGAVDEARATLKPGIPAIGRHGIPLRDELELVRAPGPMDRG